MAFTHQTTLPTLPTGTTVVAIGKPFRTRQGAENKAADYARMAPEMDWAVVQVTRRAHLVVRPWDPADEGRETPLTIAGSR